MTIFDQAFNYVLRNEGVSYVNDPKDSGGPTKFGITLRTYEDYIGKASTADSIKELTIETAKAIYLHKYWSPLFADGIKDAGVAVCIFDAAVLYGVGSASLMAQKAVNLCKVPLKLDGVLGDKSIEALNSIARGDFLKAFHSLIIVRIASTIAANPKDEKFRGGWTHRADRLLTLNNSTKTEVS